MAILIPDVGEVDMMTKILNRNLTLKLYSNNVIPSESDTAATYIEVSGGGYAARTVPFTDWTITPGAPTFAITGYYDFNFTGPTDAPGTIYGYYVVDGTTLLWAERFPDTVLPFSPVNGSLVRIRLRLEVS